MKKGRNDRAEGTAWALFVFFFGWHRSVVDRAKKKMYRMGYRGEGWEKESKQSGKWVYVSCGRSHNLIDEMGYVNCVARGRGGGIDMGIWRWCRGRLRILLGLSTHSGLPAESTRIAQPKTQAQVSARTIHPQTTQGDMKQRIRGKKKNKSTARSSGEKKKKGQARSIGQPYVRAHAGGSAPPLGRAARPALDAAPGRRLRMWYEAVIMKDAIVGLDAQFALWGCGASALQAVVGVVTATGRSTRDRGGGTTRALRLGRAGRFCLGRLVGRRSSGVGVRMLPLFVAAMIIGLLDSRVRRYGTQRRSREG